MSTKQQGARKPLNVLLVEDDSDYAALVLQWLTAGANRAEFSIIWTDSLAAALDRLDRGGIDLILMDLGLPDSNGISSFSQMRTKAVELPIVILSGGEDEGLALQTIHDGAQDYLIKFNCTADLLARAIRHTVMRYKSAKAEAAPKEANRAKIIGVLGGSGGVGATTVAAVLASELRSQTDQSTLLIDLDLGPGMIAFTTGIDPQHSLSEALENSDRLDQSLWADLVTRPAGDVDILSSTRATAAADLDVEEVRKLLGFIRMRYRWVVLDLGRLNHFSKQAIGWADEILLVTSPGISELHQCKHAIEIMDELFIDREKIRLVLNRKDTGRPWSQKEIQNLFGIEISSVLPPSHDELYAAYLRKALPASPSKIRAKIGELARRVAGMPEPLPKRSFSLKAIKILQFGVVNQRHAAAASTQERSAP